MSWDLWAPIETAFKSISNTSDFWDAVSVILGRKIDRFKSMIDECFMYRRKGNWLSLVQLIANATPCDVCFDLVRAFHFPLKPEELIFFNRCQDIPRYTIDSIWVKKRHPTPVSTYLGDVPMAQKSQYWSNLILKKCDYPRPIWRRIATFVRCLTRHGICRDLKRMLYVFLINAEVDYAVAFRCVVKNSKMGMRDITEQLFNRNTAKEVDNPARRESLAHAASLHLITTGQWEFCEEFAVRRGDSYALAWILWRKGQIEYSILTAIHDAKWQNTLKPFFFRAPHTSIRLMQTYPSLMIRFHLNVNDFEKSDLTPQLFVRLYAAYSRLPNLYPANYRDLIRAHPILREYIHEF